MLDHLLTILTNPKTCITFDRKFDVLSVRVENISASLYPG